MEIKIYEKDEVFKGFTIKAGFVAYLDEEENPLQITSGWTCNGNLYVYTYNLQTQAWEGAWEDIVGIGDDLYDAEDIEALQEQLEIIKLSEKAKSLNKKLHESEEKLVFVEYLYEDEFAEMVNYHELTPTREKGVYFYEIAQRNESLNCIGDGWYIPTDTSYKILTESDFRKMKKKYRLCS